MTPYYDRDGITLYHGDCREVLDLFTTAGGHIDHVITDPPYAARSMENARDGTTIKYRRDHVWRDFGYDAITDNDRSDVAGELRVLADRWCIVWTDIESAHLWRAALEGYSMRYVRTGVWVRENGAPQFSGDRPGQGVEACVIMHGNGERLRWNGGGRPAVWKGPIVNSQAERYGHSSPKPLWLMHQLIEQFTDPGDIILDPFAGSGTTLRAAKDLGRRAVGIEIVEAWCAAIAERLRQGVLQLEVRGT